MPTTEAKAPERVLLCLGPCHGEFYLPMDEGERPVCPNDSDHPVAVYEHSYEVRPAVPDEEREWWCETCNKPAVASIGYDCWDAGHPHVARSSHEATEQEDQ